jgi:DNA gyrase subunit A
MTTDGLVARTRDEKSPRLSGFEAPRLLVQAKTTDTLYLVTATGKAVALAVHTLPEADKLGDGTAYNKVSPLREGEEPVCAFALPARKSMLAEDTYILTVTHGGLVKKSLAGELPGPSAQSFVLVKVNDGDSLGWAVLTDGKKEILLATSAGMAIRFTEEEVRSMGLAAAGVNGIKLGVGDEVVGCQILPAVGEVFLLASDGKGKRVEVKEFPKQGRYGKGVIAWELPRGVKLAGIATGKKNDIITMHLFKAAPKMTRLDAAPLRKRAAVRGEAVVDVKAGDTVLSVTEGWVLERYVKRVEGKKRK